MTVDKKRVLITGVSGLLGNNLAYCLKDQYNILGLYNTHAVQISGIKTAKADLGKGQQIRHIINEFKPETIIHCAALSDIDYCEENQKLAYDTNVLGTRKLVDLIKDYGPKFIYISTDAVYGNANGKALCEEDQIDPANYYGETKCLGEQEVLKAENSLILRTNIFGWNIQDKFSLAEWVVHELSCKKRIQGFSDVYFSSIYTFDLSNILDEAIQNNLKGIYNCGSRTSMSKYDFAVYIADCFRLDKLLIKNSTIDAFLFKAKRTKNLAMDVTKIERALNIQAPTLEESVRRFYEDYQKGIPRKIKSKVYPKLDCIPYGCQSITEDDIQAVVETLKSSNLTQGPKIREFESKLCEVVNSDYAVAVNSGTSALHIACLAAGVGQGDEVITSPNSFVASANCAVYCGGKPVFADIDPQTYDISPREIEKKITNKTKAIIPVHFAGQSCDMEAIKNIVLKKEKEFGRKIYLIEDAAHALGSFYKGHPVGSCYYSDMTVMSFHPVKHITIGEGGIVLTKDKELWQLLCRFRSHGITNFPEEFVNRDQAFPKEGDAPYPWYYEQQVLGYNYRTTDIQCALGISQLQRLPEFVKRRREIVDYYNQQFRGSERVQTPFESPDCESNFHLYVLLFDFFKIGKTRSGCMNELKQRGIRTQVHYIPIVMQPFYKEKFGTNLSDYLNVKNYYDQCLSIPLYPSMTDGEVSHVVDCVKRLVS